MLGTQGSRSIEGRRVEGKTVASLFIGLFAEAIKLIVVS